MDPGIDQVEEGFAAEDDQERQSECGPVESGLDVGHVDPVDVDQGIEKPGREDPKGEGQGDYPGFVPRRLRHGLNRP